MKSNHCLNRSLFLVLMAASGIFVANTANSQEVVKGSFYGTVAYTLIIASDGVTVTRNVPTPPGLRVGDFVSGRFSYDASAGVEEDLWDGVVPQFSQYVFVPAGSENYLKFKALGLTWASGKKLTAIVQNNFHYKSAYYQSDFQLKFSATKGSSFPFSTNSSAGATFRIGNIFQSTPNTLLNSEQLPRSAEDIDLAAANDLGVYLSSTSTPSSKPSWGFGVQIDPNSIVFDAKSECKAGLPFDWPSPTNAFRLTQDYAELSDQKLDPVTQEAKHYHTGFDIGALVSGRPDPVFAAAEGKVVYAKYSGENKFQYAVILEHQLRNRIVYTLYGHLSEIDPKIKAAEGTDICIDRGAKLGRTGGEKKYAHLHFEVKKGQGILTNPVKHPGACTKRGLKPNETVLTDTCFGYTLEHPTVAGYLDPDSFLNVLENFNSPTLVQVDGEPAARSGPGSLDGYAYPAYETVPADDYAALATAPRENVVSKSMGKRKCDGRWYKIRHFDNNCLNVGSCFPKKEGKTAEAISDAWVCSDFVTPLSGPVPLLTPSPY